MRPLPELQLSPMPPPPPRLVEVPLEVQGPTTPPEAVVEVVPLPVDVVPGLLLLAVLPVARLLLQARLRSKASPLLKSTVVLRAAVVRPSTALLPVVRPKFRK